MNYFDGTLFAYGFTVVITSWWLSAIVSYFFELVRRLALL
jgi:hypothetical protein